jgi:endonuclease YncB( thermonuclease family)
MYLDTWDDAICTRVIDGDTIDLQASLETVFGSDHIWRTRGRLARIDAFKSSTPAGKQATVAVQNHVLDKLLRVQFVEPYKYMPKTPRKQPRIGGEYMVEVWLNGVNLSDLLVDEGHATYWDGVGRGYGLEAK